MASTVSAQRCRVQNTRREAAVEWLRKAVEQGDPGGQYHLAIMHAMGRGVPQDGPTAAELFQKASDQGLADAQYCLALLYAKGSDVPQDYEAAAKWYRKAAKQGHTESQHHLGTCYETGIGVVQNFVQAYAWYSVAAISIVAARTDRDSVARSMTPEQIAEGQKVATALHEHRNDGDEEV